ncbi:SulP family inorganic anion transporter [Rhodococcus yananensis]|uniref:SulP family inorganic anion transporter n=1 Tax=Rhodococcus yananensis TaxID=2879464 RepID=UPI001CF804A8|nr:SulP family inorganic anion transporter [Rhodococcus yananensis]
MTTLPLFPSLHGYRTRWLRADVLAGLTVWAILVPEALAYASIAGVPPVTGLYAAIPALILYAAVGSSRHLVVGPMSATAALSAAIIAPLAGADPGRYIALSAGLALVAGVLGLLAGIVKFGFVAAFISEPVLKGFIVGLALTILVGQLPTLLGVDKGSGNFFEQLWTLLRALGDIQWLTFVIGVASLILVLAVKHWIPLVPGSLLAVLAGVVAVAVFGLDERGVSIVGHINAGLPRIGVPEVGIGDFIDLLGPAAGVLFIGFAEGLGAAKTYAAKAGYDVNANRELGGLGAANLGAGLCSGMVVNGSLSKTAVNGGAGAKTQLSGLIVAVLTIVTLLFLTGLFEKLPEATLAAVVIAAVVELIDFAGLRRLYQIWTERLGRIYGRAARADFAAALAALVGVLVFDTLPGLIIGVVVSVLLLLYRASRPNVARLTRHEGLWVDTARHPNLPGRKDVLVVRVEGGLFFADADYAKSTIEKMTDHDVRMVVLDAQTSPFIDVTAAQMLSQLADGLDRRGIELRIAHDIGQVRDVLNRTGSDRQLPVYPTVNHALDDVEET